ncbi:uncharacterized protein EV420DRAFT_1731295 [Desarmillaria tabescens]|uniref:Uncharacterized protein n=1 Tax=Armillaria tabescens TaxID=1929756 RepID=A0AA39JEB7_ARMTA|nr:uncharacterized protein EV420DRAFT_1731295 [Desarmillaria tabescens]KAK0440201.1 hypothetical protein EV420DRAFT_1731295 [Desarmillaria tabescens]
MKGGVLAFLAKLLGGRRILEKLMQGPSIVANTFYKVQVHLPNDTHSECLLQDQVTMGEERAVYGFMEQIDAYPRSLIPTDELLTKYFPPYSHGWTADCSNLIMDVLDRIRQRTAEVLTEVGWKEYIQKYAIDHSLTYVYRVTQDDSNYGQSLLQTAYPTSWKRIKLAEIMLPEVFVDFDDID